MTRLYRWMLMAYPAPMRRAFGRDMAELYADLVEQARRERGVLAALAVVARTFADLPRSALAARRAGAGADGGACKGARGGTGARNGADSAARRGVRGGTGARNDAGSSGLDHARHRRGSAIAPPPLDRREGGRRVSLDGALHGLRQTLRSLRRSPAFTFVVVFTLAVGIGANTVMFTVLDGVLLSPLPYEEPEQLSGLAAYSRTSRSGSNYVPGPAFRTYRDQEDIFDSLAAAYSYRQTGADLTQGQQTRRVVVMPVSAGYFDVLGVEPLLGRGFSRDEEVPDAAVTVLSHDMWQAAFGGAPDVLGREIDLEGTPHTVVGVMPPGFRNPIDWQVDLWVPQELQSDRNSWGNYYLSVVGRLADGVSRELAQERLKALGAAMFEQNPDTYGSYGAIFPLLDDTVGDTRQMLWVLMAAVAMVLLIACVNVASLYLVRSSERGKELAIRAALGAGRPWLVAQMLGETLVLGIAGGLAGLLLSFAGLRAVVAMSPETLPRVAELGIDARVFTFATTVSLLTGLLFGVAPAWRLSRPDLDRTLREDSRAASAGRGQRRLRGALVVAEIAIALVLLFGAGLLAKSFNRLLDVDLGVQRDGILTYEVHLPEARYLEGHDRVAFYDRYFERVRAIPGVEAVGATSYLPAEGRYHIWSIGRADQDLEDDDSWIGTDVRVVDGEYFDIMGIRLLRGRVFNDTDTLATPWPAVLNQTLAELAFPDRDPIGAPISIAGDPFEVVGIVTDTAHNARGSTSPKVYVSHDQFAGDRNWAMIQTVRTSVEPGAIVGPLRAELGEVDPQLVLYRVRTFADVVARGVSPQRFAMALMTGFAAVALLLAAVGIYGVLSYAVTQRTREIGIRMALGADRAAVRAMVVRQGLLLTILGVALGTGGALALSGWLSSLLFEVDTGDPGVLATVAVVLAAVAALAGYLPARRATTVDPIDALTKE